MFRFTVVRRKAKPVKKTERKYDQNNNNNNKKHPNKHHTKHHTTTPPSHYTTTRKNYASARQIYILPQFWTSKDKGTRGLLGFKSVTLLKIIQAFDAPRRFLAQNILEPPRIHNLSCSFPKSTTAFYSRKNKLILIFLFCIFGFFFIFIIFCLIYIFFYFFFRNKL